MSLVNKIMKLEPSLTSDDFHPEKGTILVVSNNGVESIESWKHKTVSQPAKSAIDGISDSTITDEQNIAAVRAERNMKLEKSDWTQNRDVTLSNDADWKTYRQALRDITKDYKSLDDVKWPEKPE